MPSCENVEISTIYILLHAVVRAAGQDFFHQNHENGQKGGVRGSKRSHKGTHKVIKVTKVIKRGVKIYFVEFCRKKAKNISVKFYAKMP